MTFRSHLLHAFHSVISCILNIKGTSVGMLMHMLVSHARSFKHMQAHATLHSFLILFSLVLLHAGLHILRDAANCSGQR